MRPAFRPKGGRKFLDNHTVDSQAISGRVSRRAMRADLDQSSGSSMAISFRNFADQIQTTVRDDQSAYSTRLRERVWMGISVPVAVDWNLSPRMIVSLRICPVAVWNPLSIAIIWGAVACAGTKNQNSTNYPGPDFWQMMDIRRKELLPTNSISF